MSSSRIFLATVVAIRLGAASCLEIWTEGYPFAIGSVSTLAAGSSATVSITAGTTTTYKLNFGIPKGDKGDRGPPGPSGGS